MLYFDLSRRVPAHRSGVSTAQRQAGTGRAAAGTGRAAAGQAQGEAVRAKLPCSLAKKYGAARPGRGREAGGGGGGGETVGGEWESSHLGSPAQPPPATQRQIALWNVARCWHMLLCLFSVDPL